MYNISELAHANGLIQNFLHADLQRFAVHRVIRVGSDRDDWTLLPSFELSYRLLPFDRIEPPLLSRYDLVAHLVPV